jgi:hypothetical protein
VTTDLLIICVTRGRPQAVAALWDAWTATADGRADLLFAVDDDDPELDRYLATREAIPEPLWYVGPRLGLAGTLNVVAAKMAPYYRMLGSWGDDHRPRTVHWDTRLAEALDELGTGVAYGDDLIQHEAIPTATVMTSDIVRTLGYMAAPGMRHLCIDLCWLDWGKAIGKAAYLPDVIIEHCHPAGGTAPDDAGYREVNSAQRVAADSAAYHAYKAGQFAGDVAKLRALATP